MPTTKLNKIKNFLTENQEWNAKFQLLEYRSILLPHKDSLSKLNAMLHAVANTQSQPKLDDLSDFWQHFHNKTQGKLSLSLEELATVLEEPFQPERPFFSIYQGLRTWPGWGEKTAALFVKNVIKIHAASDKSLHFLSDATKHATQLQSSDEINLPVDAVIIHIFREHINLGKSPSVKNINRVLQAHCKHRSEMMLWDDLWFWGFITQRTYGQRRVTEWNPAKFWSQFSHDKQRETEVKKLAGHFIRLLEA